MGNQNIDKEIDQFMEKLKKSAPPKKGVKSHPVAPKKAKKKPVKAEVKPAEGNEVEIQGAIDALASAGGKVILSTKESDFIEQLTYLVNMLVETYKEQGKPVPDEPLAIDKGENGQYSVATVDETIGKLKVKLKVLEEQPMVGEDTALKDLQEQVWHWQKQVTELDQKLNSLATMLETMGASIQEGMKVKVDLSDELKGVIQGIASSMMSYGQEGVAPPPVATKVSVSPAPLSFHSMGVISFKHDETGEHIPINELAEWLATMGYAIQPWDSVSKTLVNLCLNEPSWAKQWHCNFSGGGSENLYELALELSKHWGGV